MEREVKSGSVWKVRNDHGIWVVKAKWIKDKHAMWEKAHQVSLYVHGALQGP